MDVSLRGVYEARRRVYQYLKPTALQNYPLLSDYLGCQAWIKHENHNPTGAFKIRGGINLISRLSAEEKARGVITATRGNHGQSIALACRIFGVKCVVAIPEGNNPEKNESMAAYGAELLIHGSDFDEARAKVEELQRTNGMRYIHSGNEPLLVHGVATYALEILEEMEPDYIFVPVGGGSGACGTLTVFKTLAPHVRIIGVQAERASAVYQSWKTGTFVQTETADTIADGLATRVPFELPFSILRKKIDEIVTVSEEALRSAVFQIFRTTHQVAEAAGAAALAAACQMQSELKDKKVVLILSGGNITTDLFREILAEFSGE